MKSSKPNESNDSPSSLEIKQQLDALETLKKELIKKTEEEADSGKTE